MLVSWFGHTQNGSSKETTNQAYCPLSEIKIAPNFTTKNNSINSITIKITNGYQKNNDLLKLTDALNHLSISSRWIVAKGELALTANENKSLSAEKWISAVRNVVFTNNNPQVSGKRTFSISVNKNTIKTQLFVPTVIEVISAERCGPGSVTLTAKAEGDVYWYDSPTLGVPIFRGENFITPFLSNTTTYYVVSGTSDCLDGKRTPITATILNIPTAQKKTKLVNCDEDGVADGFTFFNLKEATNFITLGYTDDVNISYYLSEADAQTKRNAIKNPDTFSNENAITVYARIENKVGCYVISDLILSVSTTSFPESYHRNLVGCDNDMVNDGITAFDLTMAGTDFIAQFPTEQNLEVSYYRSFIDAQLEKNRILNETNYFNKTPYNETLFVRVENKDNGACFGIGAHLTLTVMPTPEFKVKPTEILCWEEGSVTLDILEPKDSYRYEWFKDGVFVGNTRTLKVKEGGEYKVVGISTYGCRSIPRTINVREVNIAEVSFDDIMINQDISSNTITINDKNLGLGDYEYALDSIEGAYQTQPIFKNVSSGNHTIYIREKHQCGTSNIKVTVLEYPRVFTPNNDGIDDYWQITEGLDAKLYTITNLSIYNQLGKLVAEINPFDIGWDGNSKGKPLPEGEYSFAITLIDKSGKKQERKGSFKLNRN